MTEKPILFSAPMVRAILAGTKSVTRRLLKVPPGYQIDDRLWVRESFASFNADGSRCKPVESTYVVLSDGTHIMKDGRRTEPCTEYAKDAFDGIKWRPGIFMPRWASRITLAVTDVRVERLQEITEEDAKREGVITSSAATAKQDSVDVYGMSPYRDGFSALWDAINGKRAPWANNPWVWVVSFKRMQP